MSKSSCPCESEVKEKREDEIRAKAYRFLKRVAQNLVIPEGVSGRVDIAFKINRKKLVADAMRKIVEELDGDSV